MEGGRRGVGRVNRLARKPAVGTQGDGADLDARAADGQIVAGDDAARGRGVAEELAPHEVHRREVLHVGEVDGSLDDVAQVEAEFVQHLALGAEDVLGLALDGGLVPESRVDAGVGVDAGRVVGGDHARHQHERACGLGRRVAREGLGHEFQVVRPLLPSRAGLEREAVAYDERTGHLQRLRHHPRAGRVRLGHVGLPRRGIPRGLLAAGDELLDADQVLETEAR